MKPFILTLAIILSLISCHDQTGKNKTLSEQAGLVENNNHTSVMSTNKAKNCEVSDTLKKIIDELNLCQYSEFLNVNNNYDCYDKDISDIRKIKNGDNSFDNFIFQAPGGSAGGTILIYCKKDGKYQKIQEYEGYIDSILPSTTNEFHDIRIWHRAKKVEGETVLFKWDGHKYNIKKL